MSLKVMRFSNYLTCGYIGGGRGSVFLIINYLLTVWICVLFAENAIIILAASDQYINVINTLELSWRRGL